MKVLAAGCRRPGCVKPPGAEDGITEVGPAELSLTCAEAASLRLDDHGDDQAHALVAAPAARIAMHEGHPDLADRWAGVMETWLEDPAARATDPLAHAESLLAKAALCRKGIEEMRADADEAAKHLDAVDVVAPGAQIYQGLSRVLMGELDEGEAKLEEGLRLGIEHGVPEVVAYALCQQALLMHARGAHDRADVLAEQAASAGYEVGREDALVETLLARGAMRRGDVQGARLRLSNARRLLPMSTYGNLFVAAQTRLELARIYLGLGDPSGARTTLQEIDDVLSMRPDIGTLADEMRDLRSSLSGHSRGTPRALRP